MTSAEYCQELTKRSSANFYLASQLLPATLRPDFCALYAFCRTADDAVDLGHKAQATRLIERRRMALRTRRHPRSELFWPEFWRVVDRYKIPMTYFTQLLTGFESDLRFRQPANFRELEQYCVRVAGTVGLMCAKILGVTDQSGLRAAERLGVAMQLTNILRDVEEDLKHGRLYLPVSLMREVHTTPADVTPPLRPEVKIVMARLSSQAAAYFDEAERALELIPEPSRAAVGLALEAYRQLLQRISDSDFAVFGRRISLSRWQRLKLLAQAKFGHRAN